MIPFSGTVGRVLYAILAAIIAYIVVIVLAYLAGQLGAGSIQTLLERFAPVIAILIGILTFFGYNRTV
jgi:hypothetical protein